MKKSLFIIAWMLVCIGSLAAQGLSIVNGLWERGGPINAVKLYGITEGVLNEIASSKPDANNRFSFAFNPEREGFYAVALSPTAVQNRYVFYLKPGDQLNLTITKESYELTGANTPENVEMGKWHDFILPLEEKAVYFQKQNSTYVDFFPLLDEKLEALKSYPKADTPNEAFNAAFEDFKRNDVFFTAVCFIQTPRSAHPVDEDYSDYYRNLDLPALTANTSLLDYPSGVSLVLNGYRIRKIARGELQAKDADFDALAASLIGGQDKHLVGSDVVRGELVLLLSKTVKTLDKLDAFREKYGAYVATEGQKQRLNSLELALRKNVAGEKAPDFTFPDADGKEYTLSSFRGKVVYVDIWATWCGWCIKEIPHLKKLEEEYKDNADLVLISISVDKAADREKWLKFMQKERMSGIQLFAEPKATEMLRKPYKISGIPRFILVGKDGRLISGDAPRPSSEEIRPMLDEALKQ